MLLISTLELTLTLKLCVKTIYNFISFLKLYLLIFSVMCVCMHAYIGAWVYTHVCMCEYVHVPRGICEFQRRAFDNQSLS